LARYHTAVTGFDRRALHRIRARYGAQVLKRTIARLRYEWRGGVETTVERLCAPLDAHAADLEERLCDLDCLCELVIHGDYYADNLIMRDDEVVGVVDYDQAQWSWRALELAEALIFFAREREERLRQIVYSGVLDFEAVERFLAAYSRVVQLSDVEILALPQFVRLIWMCAALDPPLGPRPRAKEAAQVVPEVLYLADWAQAHSAKMQEIGFAARAGDCTSSITEPPTAGKEVCG
jgi:Ser/Thr protein kinase RdoA (MazF antagonist)